MNRPSLFAVSILAGFGLVACNEDPPAPDEVRSRISSDLGTILREANAAVEGGTEGLPGEAALGVLDRMLGSDSAISLRVRDVASRVTARMAGGGARHGVLPVDDPYSPDEDIAYLNEKLFSDANHLGEGIYQIPPALLCTETDFDSMGRPIETIDPECAKAVTDAQLRIRVSKDDDVIRFALQVGADHDEPLTLGLSRRAVSLTVDLDDAWRAAVALAKVVGEALPNASLAGQITGRLEVLGPAHARATVNIDRAIAIAFAEDGVALDGPDAYRFSSAKANVLAIELDGAAKRGSFAIGLGETKAHILDGDAAARDRIELDLPGLSAKVELTAGQPLALSQLSLGNRTTSISINGTRATAIDLNPEDGRALTATVSLDPATGRETLSVSPRLDLRVAVDHAAWGDAAPVYDVTQILLDGSVRSDETGDQLEVVTGSLRVSTNPASYGFTAAAGQCVAAQEVEDLPSGSFYTQWTVGACP